MPDFTVTDEIESKISARFGVPKAKIKEHNNFHNMDVSDLIYETISQYNKAFGKGITKTKLLKLVYLVELFYKRRCGKRLTNAEWVYYLYGPYLHNYDEILENSDINIKNAEYDNDKESQILSIKNTEESKNISPDVKFLIGGIVRDYGSLDLRSLLDHVYFENEPMMNAENRGEILDFDKVMPENYYKVKELKIDPKEEKKLRQAFRKRAAALNGKRN
jgi:uncharacterized phage-associated protein